VTVHVLIWGALLIQRKPNKSVFFRLSINKLAQIIACHNNQLKNGRRLKQSLRQHTDEQQKSAKAVVAKGPF
jgi:hypothetical protein